MNYALTRLELVCTTFEHKEDKNPATYTRKWSVIRKWLTEPHETRDVPTNPNWDEDQKKRAHDAMKDGPLFSLTQYKPGTTRAAENVELLYGFILDIDDGTPLEELEPRFVTKDGKELAYVAYSSFSSSKDFPKYRVVFPFVGAVYASEWSATWDRLVYHLAGGTIKTGGHADPKARDASRMYYLPACPTSRAGEAWQKSRDGVPLDSDAYPDPPVIKKPSPSSFLPRVDGERVPSDILINAALDRVGTEGGRNNAALWLSCQARDNEYTEAETEQIVLDYARRVPNPATFPEEEALRTVEQAFRRNPREAWQRMPPRVPQKNSHGHYSQARYKEDSKENSIAAVGEGQEATRFSHDLPTIEVNGKQLRDKTSEALVAFKDANCPPRFFARDGHFVKVGVTEKGHPRIEEAGEQDLSAILARAANWISTSEKRGVTPVAPPVQVVKDLLSLLALRGWEDVPPIEAIVTAPVIAPDGTLCETPGYIRAASVYYHTIEGEVLPDTTPTPERVTAAKDRILGTLLKDFPFVDDAGRAHALALVIAPFVRPLIIGPVPMFLIDAPAQGTGKSLLAEIACSIFAGASIAATTLPDKGDESEWRKQITAALEDGSAFVWFDNLRRKLESGLLAHALTAPIWKSRELGTSRNLTLPIRCVWIVTGNNIQLEGDFPRRSLWIRLDSKRERPELREAATFKIPDIRRYVLENRTELIGDVLTLVRAWLEAGRPAWKGQVLGGFESSCRVLGGILDTVGVPGFMENREELYGRADPEREKWEAFFEKWHTSFGAEEKGSADVISLAVECEIVSDTERGSKNYFGKLLISYVDRIMGGYRLIKGKDQKRLARYKVVPDSNLFTSDDKKEVVSAGVLI